MRRSERPSLSSPWRVKRLQRVTAAFARFRGVHGKGRRIPLELQAQVVSAVRAGVSRSSIERACGLSWSQVSRWLATVAAEAPSSRSARTPPVAKPRVLSVVDADARPLAARDADIEVRIGAWRVSLSRTTI